MNWIKKMYNIEEIKNTIIKGDCLEELKKLPDNSIDSIVTDPPAGINFMGRDWDNKGDLLNFQDFIYQVFLEAIRVLKPGGHALVWALPRTAHHTAMGIERAGFEIRDKVYFVFGSGMPKSLNISKSISKKQGAKKQGAKKQGAGTRGNTFPLKHEYQDYELTDDAKQWNGWGTSLKPSVEEWILARKPISEKNIAKNVLKWGTGGLNIDGCRIRTKPRLTGTKENGQEIKANPTSYGRSKTRKLQVNYDRKMAESNLGRFPSHLILDGSEEVEECFPNLGKASKLGKNCKSTGGWSIGLKMNKTNTTKDYNDSGSASRFFQHCPITEEDLEYNRIFYGSKASKKERNMGCEDLPLKLSTSALNTKNGKGERLDGKPTSRQQNNHPTVKSLSLMRYLCRLITPPKGIVLDMFAGSGSTLIAAKQEGFNYIGIEREEDYVKISEARLKAVDNPLTF